MLARLQPATATRKWCALLQQFSSAPAVAPVADTWRNPAAVLHGVDDLRFEDHPLPDELSSELVRVQMRSVGICGSDVHLLKKVSENLTSSAGRFASMFTDSPTTPAGAHRTLCGGCSYGRWARVFRVSGQHSALCCALLLLLLLEVAASFPCNIRQLGLRG